MSYNQICFSIFFEDKKNIISSIGELFFDKKKLNNIKLVSCKSKMNEWVDPSYGQLSIFFIGANKDISKSIYFSNSYSGLVSFVRHFSKSTRCRCIQIRISTLPDSGIFEYEIIQSGNTIRIIQLLQETKWMFFAKGEPLPYEDLSVYENRLIKNKFNTEIIKSYLNAEGVDFEELWNTEFTGVKYETISWDYLE